MCFCGSLGGLDETFGAREWPGRRRARGGGFGGAAGLLEAPGRAPLDACRGEPICRVFLWNLGTLDDFGGAREPARPSQAVMGRVGF